MKRMKTAGKPKATWRMRQDKLTGQWLVIHKGGPYAGPFKNRHVAHLVLRWLRGAAPQPQAKDACKAVNGIKGLAEWLQAAKDWTAATMQHYDKWLEAR